jgi:rfaE bifunctional protein nucleotidyltransferase chain/domain
MPAPVYDAAAKTTRAPSPKLVDASQAESAFARLPRPRVFTNGVFDLLHRGHVEGLRAARALGGSLVVGLNSDASARRLGKGPGRPINPALDRACVLAALEAVDMVVIFDEPTPLALIERLRPELYVKGGDYDVGALDEARLVERWGGRALALPYRDGVSTSTIVQRIVAGARAGELVA